LQSELIPTSSRIVGLSEFNRGSGADIQGRKMPGMAFTVCIAPTIIAPVLPALEKASINPCSRCVKPTVMLESVLALKAFEG